MFFISSQNHHEIKRICAFGVAIILLLSLVSFQLNDMHQTLTSTNNWIGAFGHYLALYSFYIFGVASYLIPIGIILNNLIKLPESNVFLKTVLHILILTMLLCISPLTPPITHQSQISPFLKLINTGKTNTDGSFMTKTVIWRRRLTPSLILGASSGFPSELKYTIKK